MTLTNFWLLPIWVIGAGAFLSFVQNRMTANDAPNNYVYEKKPWNILFCIILVLPLIIWASNRGTFADTYMYKWEYDSMPNSLDSFSEFWNNLHKDKFFYVFEVLFKTLFHSDYSVLLLVVATFEFICIISLFRIYSDDFALSILIFVLSCNYTGFMWNGMRQFIAACIIYLGTKYMYNKKYLAAIVLVLIASGFHQSSLIMIPFIIIIQGAAWNKKTMFILIVTVFIVFSINQFTDLLDNTLQETQYKNVVADYKGWEDDGVNPFRALFFSIPTLIAYIYRNRIKEYDNRFINMCINASILSSALWIVGIFTSGVFMGRLPIYVGLYANEILLPWEINHLVDSKYRGIIKIVVIGLYVVFFWYSMMIQNGGMNVR